MKKINIISQEELFMGLEIEKKKDVYARPLALTEQFFAALEKYSPTYCIEVLFSDQMSVKNGNTDVMYNRVLITALINSRVTENAVETLSLAYVVNNAKPFLKVYRGAMIGNCLLASTPLYIQLFQLQPLRIPVYDVNALLALPNPVEKLIPQLKSQTVTELEKHCYLGSWIERSIRENYYNGFYMYSLSSLIWVKAYYNLYLNAKRGNTGKEYTLFDIYMELASLIYEDDDFTGRFEKSVLVNKILNIV
jgi:hypothetical protein